jgi:hypothetical protein
VISGCKYRVIKNSVCGASACRDFLYSMQASVDVNGGVRLGWKGEERGEVVGVNKKATSSGTVNLSHHHIGRPDTSQSNMRRDHLRHGTLTEVNMEAGGMAGARDVSDHALASLPTRVLTLPAKR